MLYFVANGDVMQYEKLKQLDEVEFYNLVKAHEKRMKMFEKFPMLGMM